MSELDDLKNDLAYVQSAVRRSRNDLGAAPIYYLWAVLVAVGFALPDFAPRAAFLFWCIAPIGGGLLSIWLGNRSEQLRGIRDAALGRRQGLHWLVSGGAIGIAMLAIATGKLPIAAGASMVLLIVGFAYALAGIHLHPPLRWAGLVMMASAPALLWLAIPFLWTAIGIAVAAALVLGGISAQRAAQQ